MNLLSNNLKFRGPVIPGNAGNYTRLVYVDSDIGNSLNSGAYNSPFDTLQAAVDHVAGLADPGFAAIFCMKLDPQPTVTFPVELADRVDVIALARTDTAEITIANFNDCKWVRFFGFKFGEININQTGTNEIRIGLANDCEFIEPRVNAVDATLITMVLSSIARNVILSNSFAGHLILNDAYMQITETPLGDLVIGKLTLFASTVESTVSNSRELDITEIDGQNSSIIATDPSAVINVLSGRLINCTTKRFDGTPITIDPGVLILNQSEQVDHFYNHWYVDPLNGNDLSGKKDDTNLPFKTIQAAYDSRVASGLNQGTIMVIGGDGQVDTLNASSNLQTTIVNKVKNGNQFAFNLNVLGTAQLLIQDFFIPDIAIAQAGTDSIQVELSRCEVLGTTDGVINDPTRVTIFGLENTRLTWGSLVNLRTFTGSVVTVGANSGDIQVTDSTLDVAAGISISELRAYYSNVILQGALTITNNFTHDTVIFSNKKDLTVSGTETMTRNAQTYSQYIRSKSVWLLDGTNGDDTQAALDRSVPFKTLQAAYDDRMASGFTGHAIIEVLTSDAAYGGLTAGASQGVITEILGRVVNIDLGAINITDNNGLIFKNIGNVGTITFTETLPNVASATLIDCNRDNALFFTGTAQLPGLTNLIVFGKTTVQLDANSAEIAVTLNEGARLGWGQVFSKPNLSVFMTESFIDAAVGGVTIGTVVATRCFINVQQAATGIDFSTFNHDCCVFSNKQNITSSVSEDIGNPGEFAKLTNSDIWYVDSVNGDDSTAKKNDKTRSYQTLEAAWNARVADDVSYGLIKCMSNVSAYPGSTLGPIPTGKHTQILGDTSYRLNLGTLNVTDIYLAVFTNVQATINVTQTGTNLLRLYCENSVITANATAIADANRVQVQALKKAEVTISSGASVEKFKVIGSFASLISIGDNLDDLDVDGSIIYVTADVSVVGPTCQIEDSVINITDGRTLTMQGNFNDFGNLYTNTGAIVVTGTHTIRKPSLGPPQPAVNFESWYVDRVHGNDSTAEKNNPLLPYLTLEAAWSARVTDGNPHAKIYIKNDANGPSENANLVGSAAPIFTMLIGEAENYTNIGTATLGNIGLWFLFNVQGGLNMNQTGAGSSLIEAYNCDLSLAFNNDDAGQSPFTGHNSRIIIPQVVVASNKVPPRLDFDNCIVSSEGGVFERLTVTEDSLFRLENNNLTISTTTTFRESKLDINPPYSITSIGSLVDEGNLFLNSGKLIPQGGVGFRHRASFSKVPDLYYVDAQHGNDSVADGTRQRPYATLQAAWDARVAETPDGTAEIHIIGFAYGNVGNLVAPSIGQVTGFIGHGFYARAGLLTITDSENYFFNIARADIAYVQTGTNFLLQEFRQCNINLNTASTVIADPGNLEFIIEESTINVNTNWTHGGVFSISKNTKLRFSGGVAEVIQDILASENSLVEFAGSSSIFTINNLNIRDSIFKISVISAVVNVTNLFIDSNNRKQLLGTLNVTAPTQTKETGSLLSIEAKDDAHWFVDINTGDDAAGAKDHSFPFKTLQAAYDDRQAKGNSTLCIIHVLSSGNAGNLTAPASDNPTEIRANSTEESTVGTIVMTDCDIRFNGFESNASLTINQTGTDRAYLTVMNVPTDFTYFEVDGGTVASANNIYYNSRENGRLRLTAGAPSGRVLGKANSRIQLQTATVHRIELDESVLQVFAVCNVTSTSTIKNSIIENSQEITFSNLTHVNCIFRDYSKIIISGTNNNTPGEFSAKIDQTIIYCDSSFTGANPSGTKEHPFVLLSEAIAQVISGGTIVLKAGLYDELINTSKDFTLLGAGYQNATVSNLDCNGSNHFERLILDGMGAAGYGFLSANDCYILAGFQALSIEFNNCRFDSPPTENFAGGNILIKNSFMNGTGFSFTNITLHNTIVSNNINLPLSSIYLNNSIVRGDVSCSVLDLFNSAVNGAVTVSTDYNVLNQEKRHEWYVNDSTGNDDTGDGSKEYPFATLNKAHTELTAGDKVYIQEVSLGIDMNFTWDKTAHLIGINKTNGARSTINNPGKGNGYSANDMIFENLNIGCNMFGDRNKYINCEATFSDNTGDLAEFYNCKWSIGAGNEAFPSPVYAENCDFFTSVTLEASDARFVNCRIDGLETSSQVGRNIKFYDCHLGFDTNNFTGSWASSDVEFYNCYIEGSGGFNDLTVRNLTMVNCKAQFRNVTVSQNMSRKNTSLKVTGTQSITGAITIENQRIEESGSISNPPTQAELNAIFGTAAANGKGFEAIVTGNAGGGVGLTFTVYSDGANYRGNQITTY